MPVGVVVNSLAVAIGGLIGAFLGHKLPDRVLKESPKVFGLSSIAMGITLIVNMVNLTPVILAIILGAIVGETLQLESGLINIISKLFEKDEKGFENNDDSKTEMFITVIALFIFSATGIFGVLNEGFTGDPTILYTKSILDFFTAITFGTAIGYLVAVVAIPQFIFNIALFFSAGFIIPILSDTMLSDFRACGGIITMAVGLKLTKIKHFNVINLLPAIALVIPLSYLWTKFIG